MRKFFTIALALVLCAAAFAQETNRDENGKIKYGPYQTNKFWDNLFIGAGIGGNGHVDRHVEAPLPSRSSPANGSIPATVYVVSSRAGKAAISMTTRISSIGQSTATSL